LEQIFHPFIFLEPNERHKIFGSPGTDKTTKDVTYICLSKLDNSDIRNLIFVPLKFVYANTSYATSRNLLTKKTRQKSVASYCKQRTDSARLGSIRSLSGVFSSQIILPPQQTTKVHDHQRELTKLHSLQPGHCTSRITSTVHRTRAWIQQDVERAVAKSALTRLQTFIESGDRKVNEIQVRFDDVQVIFDRYDTAKN